MIAPEPVTASHLKLIKVPQNENKSRPEDEETVATEGGGAKIRDPNRGTDKWYFRIAGRGQKNPLRGTPGQDEKPEGGGGSEVKINSLSVTAARVTSTC